METKNKMRALSNKHSELVLSDEEMMDIEQSLIEIESGEAPRFENVEDCIAWLKEETTQESKELENSKMTHEHYTNGEGKKRKIPKYLGNTLPTIKDPRVGVWVPIENTEDRISWRNAELELSIEFERTPVWRGYPYQNRLLKKWWNASFKVSPKEGRPETKFPFSFRIETGRKSSVTATMFYFIKSGERYTYLFEDWKKIEGWVNSKDLRIKPK